MKRDPRVYLAQILECVERIATWTEAGRNAFLADRMLQDAVIRNFSIIGEAAKRVPDDYCESHPGIPWRGLAAFRDVLIHQYEGVDLDEVWRVIEQDLPELRIAIERELPPLDELEAELAGEGEEEGAA